ncbi:type I restriction endonuclease subunit R [Bombilactobacillus thymidiniphilus]|uniref:Type I restriction enzyme endonuclease subunit n=1 Tax=Bombilactobacillus thymidiniphilus TaxID=2923363 RepID=A0ABY4PFP3_9LACO|nr:HsdR family type I site-specific deoxyribonuclease [Bombilactobacillus thymidiniphilus]UQS84343.1 HsdR family type I site-specific deoxyribonuclease [Bombilactobacillus thymidiniphilus]
MSEDEFETELIQYLSTGVIDTTQSAEHMKDNCSERDYITKTKLWKYEPGIKTTEQLWANFKKIVEQNNQGTLNYEKLSSAEFKQIQRIISDIKTPYEAGQFLYGLNGKSQIEIDLDNGRHVYLTLFDQAQVGAGDTVYQVVNQIRRPAKILGKENRRFDTTLLINGLPVIQIEEKRSTHDINEALNQMNQYIDENQYSDIFSLVQILVAMSPNNVKYMANTTKDKFNKDFAFNWQRKNGLKKKTVRNWREFADSMLSIPMAHKMATNYMILDGTKNNESLKVMRPYQVYATQAVIEKIKQADFDFGVNKLGYIWHTTGSGKTITSFKTAWLASRMPNIDKVVFLVDRIVLTKQTLENYRAYDPDTNINEATENIQSTRNTNELSRKLKKKDNNIIVTSVQKLATLVKRKSFKAPDKHFVFIVDEAHRSTAGDAFKLIQQTFKHSAWVGYTGTPTFDDTTKGLRTEDIFGPLLHSYTIRDAIADHNVLGFKVDFENTFDIESVKSTYLPAFYHKQYPKWSQAKIQDKIDNLTPEDMDDEITTSFYDENPDHVKAVVKDIFDNWPNRSNEGKYNALFTTHVGGMKASTPMAMMYFDEFQRVNQENAAYNQVHLKLDDKDRKPLLKVAVTFSYNTSDTDTMVSTNQGLFRAIQIYNKEFGTNFEMDDTAGYTQDVISRLNKTVSDKNYLDIVIVVDQLLTGFDAPQLNTLYVDRTLKDAGLIQAYSRTNRIDDMEDKPWGHIINYRWPAQNEKLMNRALAIYADEKSAELSEEERKSKNVEDGVTAPSYEETFKSVKQNVTNLRNLTDNLSDVPKSEHAKEEAIKELQNYSAGIAKLKQYDKPDDANGGQGFDYDDPDGLIKALGMTSDEETFLTTVLTNELKRHISKKKNIPLPQIDFHVKKIRDVTVNYDYLTELIEQLLNQVHENKMKAAETTQEEIHKFADGLEDQTYAKKIKKATGAIIKGEYPSEDSKLKYPYHLQNSDEVIEAAHSVVLDDELLYFQMKWGIENVISLAKLRNLFGQHVYGKQDLDNARQLSDIVTEASASYKMLAKDEKVKNLSKIKYRNSLRDAIYQKADDMDKNK